MKKMEKMEKKDFIEEYRCPDVYGYYLIISRCKTAGKVRSNKIEGSEFSNWMPIEWVYNPFTGANDPHLIFPDGESMDLFFLIMDWN